MLSRERWIPTTGNYLNHRPVLVLPSRGAASPAAATAAAAAAAATAAKERTQRIASSPAPWQPAPATATECPGREKSPPPPPPTKVSLGTQGEKKGERKPRKAEEGKAEAQVGPSRRAGAGRARCFPKSCPNPRSSASGRRVAGGPGVGVGGYSEATGGSTEPCSSSGRGLQRSLSPLPRSRDARSRAPSPPLRVQTIPPPPFWRTGNACPRQGPPGGGEAVLGEGAAPGGGSWVHLTTRGHGLR